MLSEGPTAIYLQTTHPPLSDSGALTTLVNRIIIGPASPAVFLPGTNLSLQYEQSQPLVGVHCRPIQAASIQVLDEQNCKHK